MACQYIVATPAGSMGLPETGIGIVPGLGGMLRMARRVGPCTGPGGKVISENWNMDNFNADPNTGKKMVEPAENVARENGFIKEMCDELVVRRYEQYQKGLADNRAFQRRYMQPVEIAVSKMWRIWFNVDL